MGVEMDAALIFNAVCVRIDVTRIGPSQLVTLPLRMSGMSTPGTQDGT
jgi:hypothetical protein